MQQKVLTDPEVVPQAAEKRKKKEKGPSMGLGESAYVRIDAWPQISVFRKQISSFPENYNSALPPAAQLKPPYYGL